MKKEKNMKICRNCGAPMGDTDLFCGNCGAKSMEQEQPQTQPQPQIQFQQPKQPDKPHKTVNKTAVIVFIVAAVVVLIALLVTVFVIKNRKQTLNLEDYVAVEFSGYDGYGTAEVYIDDAKMTDDLYEQYEKSHDKKLLRALSVYGEAEDIAGRAKLEISKEENLSNGDKIVVTIQYDKEDIKEIAKKYRIRITGKKASFKVSELESLKEVDPFEDLEVVFEGTSPDVYVTLNDTGDEYYGGFEADKTSGIAEGETITVRALMSEEEALQQGIKLTRTTKEYTCEMVDAYIKERKDIKEDTLEDMKSDTKDLIEAYFAGEEGISCSKLEFAGLYILTVKDQESWKEHNIVYVIYTGKVSSDDKEFKTKTMFFPVKYSNLITTKDGSQTYERTLDFIQGQSDVDDSTMWEQYVRGYIDGKDMFRYLIEAEKDDYTYEVDDSLKQYGE